MEDPGDLSRSQLTKDLKMLRRKVSELEVVNTALRRSIDSLLGRESRCAIALAAARAGVWEFDLAEGKVLLDPSLGQILGLQPEENCFELEWLVRLLPASEREKLQLQRQRIESGQTDSIQLEFQVITSSSSIRWLAIDGSLALNGSGQPARLVGICRDVTAFRNPVENGSENPDA
jgi:PAS domain S-box-containing protein